MGYQSINITAATHYGTFLRGIQSTFKILQLFMQKPIDDSGGLKLFKISNINVKY